MNQSSSKNRFQRVLLIHPFGIGDALFITPVIRALKENGAIQIDLLLGSRTREVFEANPNLHQIFEWNKAKFINFKERISRFKDLVKLFFRIWKNHYQIMFDFSPTAQYAFLSLFFFWIPQRIGFNFKGKGFLLTHKIDLPDGFSDKPMVEYYLDLIRLLNLESFNPEAEFFSKENDHHLANALLQKLNVNLELPLVAVAPGGGESWGKDARLKRWPVQNFALLIKKIFESNEMTGTILILGSKNERDLGDELIRQIQFKAINLCGEVSIRIAAAILEKTLFLIANDSGLVHLANALEIPVVSIFGPVNPRVYGPYPNSEKTVSIEHEGPACRPCYQRFRYQSMCTGVECLNQLTPEEVYGKIKNSRFFDAIKSMV